MARAIEARSVHRRTASGAATWAAAAVLIVAGAPAAMGQDRPAGMPSVTPSPMNMPPPSGPRTVEPVPPPPAPGPATPLLVPIVPPAPVATPTQAAPTTTAPALAPASAPTAGPRLAPRVIDLRPDSTGFVPEHPPGAPPIEPPGAATPEEKTRDLLEVVGNAEGEINVVVGRSRLIQTRDKLSRIAIANPAVADVELISDQPETRLLNLYGRSYGATDLTIWDAQNRPTTFLVRVTIDTRDLERRFRQIWPGADVHVRQASSQIILEGQVPDSKTMAEVIQLVAAELRGNQAAAAGGAGGGGGAFAGGGGGGGSGGIGGAGGIISGSSGYIINRVRVPGPRQVLLHVKIAELNRTALRQIGVNWLDTRNRALIGSTIGGIGGIAAAAGASGPIGQSAAFRPISRPFSSTYASTASAATTANSQLFGIFNAGEFSIFINALRQNSLAKVIAEPNLMTLDGQPARFLAGGQYPYPVPQPSATGGGSVVTIQFAPYGALLSFLPNILEGDVIRLDVEPAFSELNAAGTSINGTAVPGLSQRSARTVVELREGQTLAIAGLLQTATTATTARVPGLGDLPIVGTLFSSNVINTVETELVVLVTPELVNPMDKADVPPAATDRILQPNDFEFYLLGRIEGKTGKEFRATVRELDPLNVMKHFQSESRYVVGPHGYVE